LETAFNWRRHLIGDSIKLETALDWRQDINGNSILETEDV